MKFYLFKKKIEIIIYYYYSGFKKKLIHFFIFYVGIQILCLIICNITAYLSIDYNEICMFFKELLQQPQTNCAGIKRSYEASFTISNSNTLHYKGLMTPLQVTNKNLSYVEHFLNRKNLTFLDVALNPPSSRYYKAISDIIEINNNFSIKTHYNLNLSQEILNTHNESLKKVMSNNFFKLSFFENYLVLNDIKSSFIFLKQYNLTNESLFYVENNVLKIEKIQKHLLYSNKIFINTLIKRN